MSRIKLSQKTLEMCKNYTFLPCYINKYYNILFQGDSGGPLQIYHSNDDIECMYDIVGITSFGKACSGSPGVYTRVSKYIEWIENIVWP